MGWGRKQDRWWLWYDQTEPNKYFNNHFFPHPRLTVRLCSCRRIKTLKCYKSSRQCCTQYDPQWPLTAKQPEIIQNSVFILIYTLIYKECTPTVWKKSDENRQTTITRFSHSSNPETWEKGCSARHQQACDKILPPGGQVPGLTQPTQKGCADRPRWQPHSFLQTNRFNVPGSTWSHPLNTNSSRHATTSCLCRSQKGVYRQETVFTFFTALS